MPPNEYINPAWEDLLKFQDMDSFDRIWELTEGTWYEPPNQARGGWSGVSRLELGARDGSKVGIFIKRQENHVYRSWRHFFLPTATLEREFRNCIRFNAYGIPALEVIYFSQRKIAGKLQAILVTKELQDFLPLDNETYVPLLKLSRFERNQLIASIADVIRLMHTHHMQHTCLYPKHLFVRKTAIGNFETRLIDLEKARKSIFKQAMVMRDLDSLRRHASGWSRTEQLRLFLAYRKEKKLTPASKQLLLTILHKNQKRFNKPLNCL